MATQTNTSSSSSPPTTRWTYDVFLSFRGEDTRRNFTDHLYAALNRKGIFTFRDDEQLKKGKDISQDLLKAIEESRFVIVILSRNYADSTWCLDELAKTVECMKVNTEQTVLPVFYDVDPSQVRKQTGNFQEALWKHEQAFKDNPEKVKRWRDALSEVGSLSGWHLQDGYESKIIEDIVENSFTQLNRTMLSVSKDLVAMDSHIREMLSHLELGLLDVRKVIGIWGMGGIGKTTIARVVFERIRAQFEAYSFLDNVREEIEKKGQVHLQKQLFSDMLLESNVHIQNIDVQKVIRRRLCTKRVLIILDDVDKFEQLEALCDPSWFGLGSRIIITSRDEHVLRGCRVDKTYKVKLLTDDEALQLFSWKSFQKDQVGEVFLKLSKDILKYANRLPLAIKVLGLFLYGRSAKLWASELDRLKANPKKDIIDVLKISFDGLSTTEKNVFLDIVCFFKGEDKDHVTRILESCGYSPDIDIEVLMEKSLVTLYGRKLWMHDLIQELGWEVVRQECGEDPGKRSRLWLREDIIRVLVKNKGTSKVQGIFLNLARKEEVVHLITDPFSNMDKLRLLKIWNGNFSGNIKCLSEELQFLEWHEYPFDYFPSNFQSNKLVELRMYSSHIKQLWSGEKNWSRLQFIDMSYSQYLIKTPNFSEVPNLVTLVLEGCIGLVEVHPSIGNLKKLTLLNMRDCKSVKSLPPSISLVSLKTFTLSACSRLKKFPEIKGNMKSLLELHLDGTAIKELPPSIEGLTGLTLLDLRDCKSLLSLPSTIKYLTSLKSLILTGCTKLDGIPENLHCVEFLEELDISGTAVRDFSSIANMKNLKYLSIRGCEDQPSKSWLTKSLVSMSSLLPTSLSSLSFLTNLNLSDCNLMEGPKFPDDLGSLLSLKRLNLSDNNFTRLPDGISQLSKLECLDLSNCSSLQLLPKKLPLSVRHVEAKDCTSLIDFPNQYRLCGETTIITYISSKNQELGMLSRGESTREYSDDRREDTRVTVERLLLKLKLRDHSLMDYSISWNQNEIPKWFSNTVTGDSIVISIPPGLKKYYKRWMGVAAVVLLKGPPDVSVIESDSETSNYFCQCKLKTQEFSMEPYLFTSSIQQINRMSSRFPSLYVFYEPCVWFPELLNKSSAMEASFETNQGIEVQKCGIRLLYEEDVEGFFQTVVWQCFSTEVRQYCNGNQDDRDTFESGWYNLVDNILRWESLIPSSEEVSIILLRKNIESFLPRYLEGLNHACQNYSYFVSGSPVWFNPKVGPFKSIDLPPNLHMSKEWMGFALCVSVEANKHVEDYRVFCRLEIGKNPVRRFIWSLNGISRKPQLIVMYIPRAMMNHDWLFTRKSSRQMCAVFETVSPGVKVQMCGLRILYHQNLQEFVQAITQCTLRSSDISFDYYNELLVTDWLNFIKLENRELDLDAGKENYTSGENVLSQLTAKECESKFRYMFSSTINRYGHTFTGTEIPKWFMHLNKDYHARIQVPPNLFNDDDWIGIAICASLSTPKQPSILRDTRDSEFTHRLLFFLDTNVSSLSGYHIIKLMGMHACDIIAFIHIARTEFPQSWNQCNRIGATVESNNPDLVVREWALRLVFKEDVEELVQTLTPHYMQSSKRT